MTKQLKYEEGPNPSFEKWRYHIGIENQRGEKLTEEQLKKWVEDPERMMECIFCQVVEPPSYFHLHLGRIIFGRKEGEWITGCPRCREYKGIQPHIPNWSDFE